MGAIKLPTLKGPTSAPVPVFRDFPEIVFGLVGALGSNLNSIQQTILQRLAIKLKLAGLKLSMQPIRIIDYVSLSKIKLTRERLASELDVESSTNDLPRRLKKRLRDFVRESDRELNIPKDLDVRRYVRMLAGDLYRQQTSGLLGRIGKSIAHTTPDKGGMGLLSVSVIRQKRERVLKERNKRREPLAINTIYLLHSLKHPDEAKILRTIYGEGFILIGVYKEEKLRREFLLKELVEIYSGTDLLDTVDYFIKRDMKDALKKHGQNVRDTFPLSDLFLNAGAEEKEITDGIDRFIELLFSNPRHTPTRDEYAMFHAYVAALRSSAPTRQVGAAIANENGEILTLGTNEVSKPGGGQYWVGDNPDLRDLHREVDPNSEEKRKMKENLFENLKPLLQRKIDYQQFESQVKGTTVDDITEFDRTVHAEMAALSFSAKLGLPLEGSTLYCTTFPCHLCAKNILAAGIKKLVYVEPYPKSKAPELYPEAFGGDDGLEDGKGKKFSVSPFIGIGPRLFQDLFSVYTSFGIEVKRKEEDGRIIKNPELRLKVATRAASQAEMEAYYLSIINQEKA